MIIFFLCLVVLILCVLFLGLRHYDDFDVKESYERVDASETSYVDFNGNLLKYSRDGAFYTEYDGDLIWNYTYEMTDPQVDVCGSYLLIYDEGGTQVAILTNAGFRQSIKTAMPIVDAKIASQGTVAILMQEDQTGYIQLCDVTGSVLASGELHMKNSGYPMAIAISSTAQRLMVSQLDVKNGDIKTTIAFYDFGTKGQESVDNIIATYSFAGQIFPEIAYVDGDRAIAFGDGEVVTFSDNAKASIAEEIFIEGEIQSIFYDDDYWGIIEQTTDEEGNEINQMSVYTIGGFRRLEKTIDISYTSACFLSNHEVLLSNTRDAVIYTLTGIKKFTYTFDAGIYAILPQDSSRRYVFICDGVTQIVRLR